MNCTVIRDNEGLIQDVLTQTGEPSKLYYDLLFDLNNDEEALKAYALTLTPSFNSSMGTAALNEQGEHTLKTYKSYTSRLKAKSNEDIFNYSFADFLMEEVYSISDEHAKQTQGQYTEEQNKTLHKVLADHNSVIKENDGNRPMYFLNDPTTNSKIRLKGVTTILRSSPVYGYQGSNEDNKYIAWGNVLDTIMNEAVSGNGITVTTQKLIAQYQDELHNIIDPQAVIAAYIHFEKIVKAERDAGNIVLSQVAIPSLQHQAVGIADLYIIQPDGKIKIYDLKSSYLGFDDNSYKTEFSTPTKEKTSRFKKHSAQISMMAAFSEVNGLQIADRAPLAVVPATILVDDLNQSKIGNLNFDRGNIEADYLPDLRNRYSINNITRNKKTEALDKIVAQLDGVVKTLRANRQYDTARQLQSFITDAKNKADGLDKVIEKIHFLLFGDDLHKGYVDLINLYLDQLEDETYDNKEVLDKIDLIEKEIDLIYPKSKDNPLSYYNSIINNTNAPVEEGSINAKLKESINAIGNIRAQLHEERPKALANILAKQIPDNFTKNIRDRYIQAKKKYGLALAKDAESRATQKAKEELDDLELVYAINTSTNEPDIAKMLYQQIKNGTYVDIEGIDRWVASVTQSPVAFVPLYAKMVKDAFETARLKTIKQARIIDRSYRKFIANPLAANKKTIYEDMVEERDIYDRDTNEIKKTILAFVDVIDRNKYNKELYETKKEVQKLVAEKKLKQAGKLMRDWYEANTQPRPQDDVVENGVVVIEGINTIFKRKEKQLGRNSDKFNQWVEENKIKGRYVKELAIPLISKYKNPRYDQLKKSKSYEHYSVLLKQYFDAQSLQPPRGTSNYEELKYFVPNVREDLRDGLVEDPINAVKTQLEEFKRDASDDQQFYGAGDKTIPIMYFNGYNSLSASEVSKDLTNSVTKYVAAANTYEKRVEMSSIGDALIASIEGIPGIDSNFTSVVNAVRNRTVTTAQSSRAANQLKDWIDSNIYGQTKKKTPKKLDKYANAITRFASFFQIGSKPLLALSNYLMANTQAFIESATKQVYGTEPFVKASAYYNLHIPDLMSDFSKVTKETFIGKVVEAYDPLQGETLDELERSAGRSTARKILNPSTAYIGMAAGEHSAQVKSMLAGLIHKQVKRTVNGKTETISILDAMELVNGELVFKSGVDTTGLNLRNGIVDIDLQNKIHSVNTRNQGLYNKFEDSAIMREWYGQFLMLYKRWLPQGLKSRFKREGYDYMLDEFTYGTYRKLFQAIILDGLKNIQALKQGAKLRELYNPAELAAMYKAVLEIGLVLATALLYMGLDDDEEEQSEFKKWVLYTIFRLNQELAFFGAPFNPLSGGIPQPKQLWRQITAVSAITGTVEQVIDIAVGTASDGMSLLFGGDIDRYKRDTPMFDEGTSKTLAKVAKLFGYSNTRFLRDPDDAIRLLELNRGTASSD